MPKNRDLYNIIKDSDNKDRHKALTDAGYTSSQSKEFLKGFRKRWSESQRKKIEFENKYASWLDEDKPIDGTPPKRGKIVSFQSVLE